MSIVSQQFPSHTQLKPNFCIPTPNPHSNPSPSGLGEGLIFDNKWLNIKVKLDIFGFVFISSQ
jgi:hypothetical protein